MAKGGNARPLGRGGRPTTISNTPPTQQRGSPGPGPTTVGKVVGGGSPGRNNTFPAGTGGVRK